MIQDLDVTAANTNGALEVLNDKTVVVIAAYIARKAGLLFDAPPFANGSYGFTATVKKADGTVVTSPLYASNSFIALWHAPPGLARYSPPPDPATRDEGGDDWAAKSTYAWMKANPTLLLPYNDICGEHARFIGHDHGHTRGINIDFYHFYAYAGTTILAGENYTRFVADILSVARNDASAAAAKERVAAFVSSTRSGIDKMAASPRVTKILYIQGAARSQGGLTLPVGWAANLLTSGKLTGTGFSPVTIVATPWTMNKKYLPHPGHNDHVHVELDGREN